MKNSISVKLKLDEPVYIDENTVEIGWYFNGKKQSNPLLIKMMDKVGIQ